MRRVGSIDFQVTLGGGIVTGSEKLIRFFLVNVPLTEDQVETLWGNKDINIRRPDRVFEPTVPFICIPKTLWISSGIRSLDHCIEALCSLQKTQGWKPVCQESVRDFASWSPYMKEGAIQREIQLLLAVSPRKLNYR